MPHNELGKLYADGQCSGEVGDVGNCMYVVQSGKVDVFGADSQGEMLLATLGKGNIFGEMALFTKQPRSATVRARGEARVLTIDKRGFFRRVQEDPSLAFNILQTLSQRIEELDRKLLEATPHQSAPTIETFPVEPKRPTVNADQ